MSESGARAFVTGWPIAHSRSPLIHGHWLERYGIAGRYEALAVEPQNFADFLGGLRQAGYAGGNVTIPHKEAAVAAVARRDGAAQAIGAVNTLWFEDGVLIGGNTDSYGFSANLDELLPGWRDAGEAVVLGAGGAARAVVHALIAAGIGRVRVVNRNAARAEALASAFGPAVEAHGLDREAECLRACDLLVNTRPSPKTGAGLDGDGALPELDALPGHALVTDIVYVPAVTPLLAAAAARGLRTAGGLGMLLHQAVPGFERWFGVRPEVSEALRALVTKDAGA
ncbi:shikimate dehydrogenase [Aureimonas mangrovi]|uniref:shikimate dehydrogenase n=1 Tax=Aureimonas mangrovi TaxID=2758041 RepID=UPI00163D8665|nr:shikimate dehydrogenase [Aureimonas mangrovi]